ncbi:hypothetical protein ACFL6L_02480 [candidate division KSB1 bacterium]
MKRREFLEKAGCGTACFVAAPFMLNNDVEEPQSGAKKYKIEIEIFEAREDTWCHKKGDKFSYPDDIGKLCPWLLGSMRDFILVLEHGAVLPWKYEGTPYEKVIDPDKVTTEFVRCPDPTADFVAKIIRTRVS